MPYVHGYRPAGRQTRLYAAWSQARSRCTDAKRADFKYYGARGISMCKRWNSFVAFAADMGKHPGKGYSLDRKRNHLGYSKANCKWSTIRQQLRNRRPFIHRGRGSHVLAT